MLGRCLLGRSTLIFETKGIGSWVRRSSGGAGGKKPEKGADMSPNQGGTEKASDKVVCCKVEPKAHKPEQVKVAVIGAESRTGQMLSLQLKLNPLVKELRLFDSTGVHGVAADLRHVCTSTKVLSFAGDNQIKYALKKADIVVLVGGAVIPPGGQSAPVFCKNANRMKELAFACLRAAPDAIYAIFVEPINSTLPLFAEVFRQNGVFTPNKVLGGVALDRVRSRTVTATKLGLDPGVLRIQLIGGAGSATTIPVITGAHPGGEYLRGHTRELIQRIRLMNEEVTAAKCGIPPVLSLGYAAANFVDTLAKGICEIPHCPYPALVRTNTLEGVKYLVTPLTFGPGGVAENLGLPRLSRTEMEFLEESIPVLQEEIARGEAFVAPAKVVVPRPAFAQPCLT